MPTYAATLIARRSGNGHLGTLIRQLDEVLYASFVASYMLDANFLNFIIRCVSQLQFSAPKEHHPERSLRFHVTAALIINFLNCIYHLGVPLTWDPRGITIDFIGQSYLPSLLQVLILDCTTAVLQLFLIILTYETGHYGTEADLDDSDPLMTDGDSPEAVSEEDRSAVNVDATLRDIDISERPILDLWFKQTIRRILHDKPFSLINQEDPLPNSSEPSSANARLQRQQQARMRSRMRRTSNLRDSVRSFNSNRVDAGSDEEREVGLSVS